MNGRFGLSKKLFNQPPSTNSRQESSWPFQSLPFDKLRANGLEKAFSRQASFWI
ncbi:MAG: hypothetical protein LBD67_02990 [Candidatus Accumulibacter sp.]|nr:hypothetical protein [Accumulibacter sp.]